MIKIYTHFHRDQLSVINAIKSRIASIMKDTYRNKVERETSTWRGSLQGWSEGNERARVVGGSRGDGGG